jgi:translation initiation factor 2 subunit 2
MDYNYEELLQRARAQIPEVTVKDERLELPNLLFSVVGMRTILHNFKEIADALNRQPKNVLKFLTREMATAASMQESRVIFQGKFQRNTLTRLLRQYIESYVICPICQSQHTKIMKEKRLSFLMCEACGAKSSIVQL